MQAAFVTSLPCSAFSQTRWRDKRFDILRQKRVIITSARKRCRPGAVAMHGPSGLAFAQTASILLAEDMYGQIFLGGIGIILSGVVGAFIVAFLIRNNLDEFEAEFQNRDNALSMPVVRGEGNAEDDDRD